MKCTQFSLFTGDQMASNNERAITVVVSGHIPAIREWRPCNSLSDVCYLCTRKDGNLSTQSVPEEKSINYADQLIELATDYIDLRILFTLLSASGPSVVLLPFLLEPIVVRFRIASFTSNCSPRTSLVFVCK
jgi:hypothetical protein